MNTFGYCLNALLLSSAHLCSKKTVVVNRACMCGLMYLKDWRDGGTDSWRKREKRAERAVYIVQGSIYFLYRILGEDTLTDGSFRWRKT